MPILVAVDTSVASTAVLGVVLGASVVGLGVLLARLRARRREAVRLRRRQEQEAAPTPAPPRHRAPENPADWRAEDRRQILEIAGADGSATFLCSAVAEPGSLDDDERGRLRAAHESLLRVHAERHHGRVVRPLGDGFLAVFVAGPDAVRAAFGVRRDLATTGARRFEGTRVDVRTGIHAGTVLEHDAAVAGRVESYAAAGEVLTSQAVVDELRGDPRFNLVPAGAIELESFLGTHALWRAEPATAP